ncbi:M23 family metallopeptidase [Tropicimonas sp. IMCC34043]|uniref:M23 family metallopeptidase n=1 Tax=Tropicimonas sp. IMCC34043 TaxID=2248760 RepID=UPI001E3293DB|nr:M23 family metallopeptidase [Tropicimonas sp. IMCC34043]
MLPIDCVPGTSCRIQQYVDRDPGPGSRDVGCGALANDGHKGTDFALPDLQAMRAGVEVRAAAGGLVQGLRDGMPDIDASLPAAPNLDGRECGNGVTLDHGDGWQTQYCHMRQGSIAVAMGQRVEAGATLGRVGMSGRATFPHLHLSLRQDNRVVDPFGPDMSVPCGMDAGAPLWDPPIPYRDGGLVSAGVLDRVPDFAEIKEGLATVALPDDPPDALVVWALAFAGHSGDVIDLALDGPEGSVGHQVMTLEKDQPLLYRAWGLRAPAAGFPAGAYRARIRHLRGGIEIDRRSVSFTLP